MIAILKYLINCFKLLKKKKPCCNLGLTFSQIWLNPFIDDRHLGLQKNSSSSSSSSEEEEEEETVDTAPL
jgi:hypothetical protein